MKYQVNNNNEVVENAAIVALAASTKTPFKTAFLAKSGIILAQTLATLIGLVVLGVIVTVAFLLVK